MAQELVEVIGSQQPEELADSRHHPLRTEVLHALFTALVNSRNVSLRNLSIFHMDECLDWQARPLPANHPYNFRTFMEKHFYGGIRQGLAPYPNRSGSGSCPPPLTA